MSSDTLSGDSLQKQVVEARKYIKDKATNCFAFASHLTGHSEITIRAMYQEWVGNKNKPFKPL